MLPNPSLRKQIEIFNARGNQFLSEASSSGSKEAYEKAIQEFISSYKHALLLNSEDGTERACAFNLGAAHIAGGDASRGVDVLLTVLDQGKHTKPQKSAQKSDSSNGDIFFNLAIGHEKLKEYDKAMEYYKQALDEYCKQKEDQRKLSETHLKLANLYAERDDYIQAQRSYSAAARLYQELGDVENAAMALVCQANAAVSDMTVTREECIRILDYCCTICTKLHHVNVQGKILCEVGLLYSTVGHMERALLCFEASVKLYDKDKNLRRRAVALQNAGAILNTMGRYKESVPYHAEASQIHGLLGNRNAQGQSFCNLGYAESQLERYEHAGEAFLHALQAFKDTNDKQGQWQSHEGLGAIAYLNGNLNKAERHFKMAIATQAQTKNIDAAAQERLVAKLTTVLQSKMNRALTPEKRLEIGNTSHDEPASPEPDLRAEDFLFDDNDEEEIHQKHRSRGRRGRKKRLKGGRRQYDDEDDRPMNHVARGLSNLTQSSFQHRLSDTRDDERKDDAKSNFPFKFPLFGSSSSSEYESDDDLQSSHKLKNQLRSVVEASAAPINILTADSGGSRTSTPRKLITKRHANHGRHTFTGLVVNEESPGLENGETTETTPRTELNSSSEANMTQVYRKQLSEIKEHSDEDNFTSVTSTSSDSSDEGEATFESTQSDRRTTAPVKPQRNKANITIPDQKSRTYQNAGEPVYAQSLKATAKSGAGENIQGTTSHLYESIKTVKISENPPESGAKPILQAGQNIPDSNSQNPQDPSVAPQHDSSDDAPPLSSLYSTNQQRDDSHNVAQYNAPPSTEPASRDPPIYQIPNAEPRQNVPLPPIPSDKTQQRKNKRSRACVIM